jgi:hypothetical protein
LEDVNDANVIHPWDTLRGGGGGGDGTRSNDRSRQIASCHLLLCDLEHATLSFSLLHDRRRSGEREGRCRRRGETTTVEVEIVVHCDLRGGTTPQTHSGGHIVLSGSGGRRRRRSK